MLFANKATPTRLHADENGFDRTGEANAESQRGYGMLKAPE